MRGRSVGGNGIIVEKGGGEGWGGLGHLGQHLMSKEGGGSWALVMMIDMDHPP